MIKLTEMLSKPVISLSNCKTEGIINNAVFDKSFKRLKYLVLFDNNEHLEDKSISINSIYSYGVNAIIIKDAEDLSLAISTIQTCDKSSVINCSCYTYLGKFLGKVTDIYLDEKYYIKTLVVGQTLIDISDIINTGEDTVIVQDDNIKVNVSSLKRRSKKCIKLQDIKLDKSQKVYILSSNEEKSENEVKADENIEACESIKSDAELVANAEDISNTLKVKYKLEDTPSQPKMVTTNFKFLIGRRLERNIYSSNYELIARKNTKITQEIINKARLLNKTRELIKFSK